MNETIASRHGMPRAVLLTALTAGIFVAVLVFQTGIAHAAYKATVQKGTLEITGNGASDKLAFGLSSPSTLFVDVGEDGTTDFSFDRAFSAIDVQAGGGADEVRVVQLGGPLTDIPTTIDGGPGNDNTVNVDLSGTSNTPDGAADTVTVDGTIRRDRVDVPRFGSTISVAGLQAQTNIFGSDPALDTLLIKTFEGTDDVTVAQDVADLIVPVIDLGADQ